MRPPDGAVRYSAASRRGRRTSTWWACFTLEDMIDVVESEATEDMYRMIGVDRSESAHGPIMRSVRNRLPWLCVNLGTAILAGLIIALFQSTLGRAVALAAFLPVIAGQGGICGHSDADAHRALYRAWRAGPDGRQTDAGQGSRVRADSRADTRIAHRGHRF